MASVSFGLPGTLTKEDIVMALQDELDQKKLPHPIGVSVATNKQTRSRFGSVAWLNP